MQSDICIVGTGGTFDKSYDHVHERMGFFEESCLPIILRRAFMDDLKFVSLFQVDSLDMSDSQRLALLRFVRESAHTRFVIVHGTSKMIETGISFLEADLHRVIVMTGALQPFRYDPVEACVNLGGAITMARMMEPGVIIYMNGRAFDPSACQKDPATGLFQPALPK